MCGIIGYSGPLEAGKLLLNGLAGLEYRGYDSAGIAYFDGESRIQVVKKVGKVAALRECAAKLGDVSHCGIGHTRWATHGGVTQENAHPHRFGRITLIHNGIIENYHQLTVEYGLEGKLVSQTDTEVAAGVLDALYSQCGGDPMAALKAFAARLKGSYGFCILFEDHPGEIYALRNVSPLVAAYTPSGALIASDLTALISYTREYFVVPEQHIVRLTPYKVRLYDMDGNKVAPEMMEVSWNMDAAMKNGFPHFMLKEIHEQPEALRATVNPRVQDGLPALGVPGLTDEYLAGVENIHIVACGTAMHAGMVGKTAIERIARVPVYVDIASEFRYRDPILGKNDLVVIISQSGETLDTLAALKLARERGAKTLAVVNVVGSSIARAADWVLYTYAGPEIAVASTKAYSVQMAVLYLFALRLALARGAQDECIVRHLTVELQRVPELLRPILKDCDNIKYLASQFMNSDHLFFMGRGFDYALSLEGSLKLKEISYVHSEAYAAGELKHGTISLIVEGTPVVALATQDSVYEKTISNVKEVKTRGGRVILLCKQDAKVPADAADHVVRLPEFEGVFMPLLLIVPLQLFAYYMSVLRGCDVDKPRNLAKSVTVE